MKKQLMTLALAAVVGSACADYVESSNIVGYEKVDLAANTYFISGVQFVKVGGENASLNDLLSGVPYDTELLFLNERGTYDRYSFLEEAYVEEDDTYVEGWGDSDEYYTSEAFAVGTGFWVKPKTVSSLTQVGEVSNSSSIVVDLPADQYVLVANGLPKSFDPNDATWNGLEFDTEILVLNNRGTYDRFSYLEEAYDEQVDDYVEGWGDSDEYLVIAPIVGPGVGFWIKSPSTTSVTISL